jgi:hypothetical protein
MKDKKHSDEWSEGDRIWQLLGRSAPMRPSARFVDDVARAVRILPAPEPFWPRMLKVSTYAAGFACVVLAASIVLDDPSERNLQQHAADDPASHVGLLAQEQKWEQIEVVAKAELLVAAADHLDRFSDLELISIVGF